MVDLRYLTYLRGLNQIVIPREFTYFVHNTSYGKNETEADKMWEEVPADEFTVKREMSFVERDDRLREALDNGGVIRATNSYAVNKKGKIFQIRVLMPRQHLTQEQMDAMGMTPEERKSLNWQYRGLGDGRHPKLEGNTKVFIFSSSQVDEISGQSIDILYGIREQDLERYAKLVHAALKSKEVPHFTMAKSTQEFQRGLNKEEAISDFESSVSEDYFIEGNSLSRYKRKIILDSQGKPSLIGMSEFEKEALDKDKSNLQSWDLRNWDAQAVVSPQINSSSSVPSIEEKLKEDFSDTFDATNITQIQDTKLLQQLRLQFGIDPNQSRIECYFCKTEDKSDSDYDGVGIFLRDRLTGKVKQVKLPIADEIENDKLVDVSRSARTIDGKMIASRVDRLASFRLNDGSIISVFENGKGDLGVGTNDQRNPSLVTPATTSQMKTKSSEDTQIFH